jgi:hypothetical protein
MAYALARHRFIYECIRQMVSRRGTPSYVISDNGTNFVSEERELRELVERLDQEKIVRDSSRFSHIEWHFNPPASPHFGGVFEAMIKIAEKAIKGILGNADVPDEELHTAVCGAEKLLNSRPITYVSSDSNDLYYVLSLPIISSTDRFEEHLQWKQLRKKRSSPAKDGIVFNN